MKPTITIVRSFHCDSYQHVNNARYLEILEASRWNHLNPIRKDGYFERNNLIFLVVNINISYKFPAVVDDVLETDVKLLHFGKASVAVKQRVYNKTKDKLSAEAEITFVLYDTEKGRSAFITDEIKEKFTSLENAHQD